MPTHQQTCEQSANQSSANTDVNLVLKQVSQEVREVIRLLEADKQTGTPSGYVKQARTRLKQLAKSFCQ